MRLSGLIRKLESGDTTPFLQFLHFSQAFHRMIKVIIPVEDSLDLVTGSKTI